MRTEIVCRAVLSATFLVTFLATGCRGTGVVGPGAATEALMPLRSVRLEGAVAAMCPDGGSLLCLERSGTRIIRLNAELVPAETIPLVQRLTDPRGVAADRFYIYVHDDRALSRMLKEDLELKGWLNNIRVAGMVGFAPGEMLVSDEERKVIWYKTIFGESRGFLDAVDVLNPRALAALPDGEFCVLGDPDLLLFFNRAGIIGRTVKLGRRWDMLASGPGGVLFLAAAGQPEVQVVRDSGREAYLLPGGAAPVSIAALSDRLVVLDNENRIAVYQMP